MDIEKCICPDCEHKRTAEQLTAALSRSEEARAMADEDLAKERSLTGALKRANKELRRILEDTAERLSPRGC